jgi:hypothetical protein
MTRNKLVSALSTALGYLAFGWPFPVTPGAWVGGSSSYLMATHPIERRSEPPCPEPSTTPASMAAARS